MSIGRILRRPRAPRALGTLLAAIFASSSLGASAQVTPPPTGEGEVATPDALVEAEPTTAREWFTRGENEYRVGRYQTAAEAWERAYALDARPRIQYNLAQAYERLGRLEDAVTAYQIYTSGSEPDDPVYPDAMARLTALRERVAATGMRLHGGPSGGEIFVDGQPWGMTPRPDRIPLASGNHRVEVRYPRDRAFRASFTVPAGQVTEIEVTEDAITGNTTEIVRVEVEAEPSHAMLFAGAGMAAVGIGTLVYGIERQLKVSTCNEANNYCENLATGERQRSIGLGIGSTLTVAGAALVVVDLVRHAHFQHHSPGALACAPLLTGATCRLRF